MEKNELEQLEEKMQNLLQKLMDKTDEIDNIVSDNLELYNATIKCEMLEKEYKDLSSQYELVWQRKHPCAHHIWYVQDISGSINNALGIRQCLRCEQINRWLTYSLASYDEVEEQKMIWTNHKNSAGSYENIRQEFLELESEGYSLEEIRDILYNNYTKGNEELARNLKIKYKPKHRELRQSHKKFT